MNRFCHYQLRTTDTEVARAFYTAVLGPRFWNVEVDINPLPAPAIARGAVPHWLGHISVDDVSVMTERFVARGATQLAGSKGTRPMSAAGTDDLAILRDADGAVLALSSSATCEDAGVVAWHVLHARDETAASAVYADLFGWRLLDGCESQAMAGQRTFGWNTASPPAGIIANTAQLPGVHAHWLFFFPTDDVDQALDVVLSHGGRTLPVMTAYGQRLAPCEDAQGAAFGLSQRLS